MYRISLMYLLVLLLGACSKEDLPTPSSPPVVIDDNQNNTNNGNDDNNNNNGGVDETEAEVSIQVLSQQQRVFLNRQATILRLGVKDGDLAVREVLVRISQSEIAARGALVLTSQGFGNNYYGRGDEKQSTILFAINKGLQVFEIRWDGEYGWGTDVESVGYTKATRAYTRVVEWLKANRMAEPSLVIAHGGSGGSMQIAYGMVRHNLEAVLDYGILAAGPPTSDLGRGIYGNSNDEALWPDEVGLDKTDYILGWLGNGDYCANRGTTDPPDFVRDKLEDESLVSNKPDRDYDYALTKLYFINTNDVTNADKQGLLYYEKITSEKEWVYISNETAHDVGGIEAGAHRIRQALLEILQ